MITQAMIIDMFCVNIAVVTILDKMKVIIKSHTYRVSQ